MFELDALIWFIKYTSTRINLIINKNKNNNKDNLSFFCNNKEDLGVVRNLNQVDNSLNSVNLNQVKEGCTLHP